MTAIALVGMPGSGKSTAGRRLARQLGLRFVDVDTVLEERFGQPIRAFFETRGETAFRDAEQDVIEEISQVKSVVIATGGGSVIRKTNRHALHSRCFVIYLRTSAEELHRRLRRDSHRPLLQVADPLQRLRDLLCERDPLYCETAHCVFEGHRLSIARMVHRLQMQIELDGLITLGILSIGEPTHAQSE